MSWGDLSDELISSGAVSRIPQDPLNNSDPVLRTYRYGASDDLQDYVLGVMLETEDAVLQDSYNVDIYGVSCSDAQMYCIIP
jgi:hypothetical protein